MTNSHTPVPWVIEASYSELFVVQRRCGNPKFDKLICSLDISRSDLNRTEQAYADACLIAAAPDLLGVIKKLGDICGMQSNLLSTATDKEKDKFIKLVYDLYNLMGVEAITKATGGKLWRL